MTSGTQAAKGAAVYFACDYIVGGGVFIAWTGLLALLLRLLRTVALETWSLEGIGCALEKW